MTEYHGLTNVDVFNDGEISVRVVFPTHEATFTKSLLRARCAPPGYDRTLTRQEFLARYPTQEQWLLDLQQDDPVLADWIESEIQAHLVKHDSTRS